MLKKLSKTYILYLLVALFVIGNVYVLVKKRDYFFEYNAIPFILIVGYYAIYNLQSLLFLLAFITPLSVSLKELGYYGTVNLSLPAEPLMAGLMLLYFLNKVYTNKYDRRINFHPLTIIIYIQLFWIFVTMLTSEDVLISLKFLISRCWFLFSCYFLANYLFKNKKNIVPFLSAYMISLAIVCAYTIFTHSKYGFDHKSADWVMSPFYNDHTAYGAALAMFIPVLVSFLVMKSINRFNKMMYLFLLILFIVAVTLSYARAAWLGVAVAFAVFITLIMKFNFKVLITVLFTLGVLMFSFQDDILIALGRNNTDAEEGFLNNIESVANISTDASNLERLNRWSCAVRMWQDMPVFGWGPGTYMFMYAPYQLSSQKTVISTNFGTNGNAHSEYLGPLAEEGLPGLLIVLCLMFYTFNFGYRLYKEVKDPEIRILGTGVFLGLVTYFIHGFINNFLDTDKLSLPFWSFLSIMLCIDLFHKGEEPKEQP
ncbi:MAG: O-antigen ligase family protein [Bacteroidia bacterium]|nr:O-antigen ligase family protein [Bacteroidia bacterium]